MRFLDNLSNNRSPTDLHQLMKLRHEKPGSSQEETEVSIFEGVVLWVLRLLV
jgi:hypothetical protein